MTSIGAIIGQSFGRIGAVLFSPFSPARWLRLMAIAFLAGALGTGGCALQSLMDSPAKKTVQSASPAADPAAAEPASQAPPEAEALARSRYRFVDGIFRPDPSRMPEISPLWIAAVLAPLLILFLLACLAAWFFAVLISVRFKFMWLRAVREGEWRIRTLYARCRAEADELFDFWIALSAIEIFCYTAAAGWLIGLVVKASGGWGQSVAWSPATSYKVMSPALAALAVVWGLFSILRIVGDDFLVPLTVRHPGSRGIWGRWVEIYKRHRAPVWGYLAIRLGLALFWGAVQVTAAVLYVILWAVLAVTLFVLFGWASQAWPALKAFFLFYAVLIGTPLFAVLLAGIGASLLPGAVFFREFSARMLDRIEPPPAP